MKMIKRCVFIFVVMVSVILVIVCGNGVNSCGFDMINVCVEVMLNYMYDEYFNMIDFVDKVVGMLVMLLIIEVGFGFGGGYGWGVLKVNDEVVDYYFIMCVNFGF